VSDLEAWVIGTLFAVFLVCVAIIIHVVEDFDE